MMNFMSGRRGRTALVGAALGVSGTLAMVDPIPGGEMWHMLGRFVDTVDKGLLVAVMAFSALVVFWLTHVGKGPATVWQGMPANRRSSSPGICAGPPISLREALFSRFETMNADPVELRAERAQSGNLTRLIPPRWA